MDIHIPDMVWAIINFLILVAILNKFLYKPFLGLLDARKQEIQNSYDDAEQARSEAQKVKEEYTQEMQNAKQEAQSIIAKATKLAEDTKTEIVQEAREEANKLTKKAQEDIALEKDKAINELRDEVVDLAILAAGKVVGKTIEAKDHENMIRGFVNEVGDVS